LRFNYTVLTKAGRTLHGVTEAPSERVAEEALWRSGYTIAKLQAVRAAPTLQEVLPSLFSVSRRDLIIFSRQMATLLGSGVAILPALQLMSDQVSNAAFQKALLEIVEEIQTGSSFSEALSKHREIFPMIYHRMAEVGERTGRLELILRQLAIYMEKEDALLKKVQAAMVYPAVILVMAIGVVILMVTVALPAMMGLFVELKVELPITTRILLGVTYFARDYGVMVAVGLVILGVAMMLYIRTPAGRHQWHYTMLKTPVLGGVNLKGGLARLSRTMSILLRAGLPLVEVMDLMLRTTENVVIAGALATVRSELLAGRGLSGPLADQRIFPKLLVQMVRVGEETGTLDGNLETLADFYEEEADRAIATMTALIEPGMIIFVGGIVGFIAVSVVMPMYSIMGSMK
jgi:type IV pilus assembly protein PilC